MHITSLNRLRQWLSIAPHAFVCFCVDFRLRVPHCIDMFGDSHHMQFVLIVLVLIITIIYWHYSWVVITELMLGLILWLITNFSPLYCNQSRVLALPQALKGLSQICQYYIVQCIEMLLSFIFYVLYLFCFFPQLFAFTFHDRPNHIF